MIKIKGHFDGRAIVPDEPVNLPSGQPLVVSVELAGPAQGPAPAGVSGAVGATLLRFAGSIEPDDLRAMTTAIREGCERIDAADW